MATTDCRRQSVVSWGELGLGPVHGVKWKVVSWGELGLGPVHGGKWKVVWQPRIAAGNPW